MLRSRLTFTSVPLTLGKIQPTRDRATGREALEFIAKRAHSARSMQRNWPPPSMGLKPLHCLVQIQQVGLASPLTTRRVCAHIGSRVQTQGRCGAEIPLSHSQRSFIASQ